MSRLLILDCDPGHDDAVALLLTFASPELDLLGVTVTHGNVALARTLHNALALREFAGASVPVFSGAERPLARAPLHAPHVHGESGLGNVTLPEPTRGPDGTRAAAFIADAVLARPGEVTLVATGPLTNVALALALEPRLATEVREIVLMGGSLDYGNASMAAEFNFLADPHAAHAVFSSGAKVTMFGLNVTRQVRVSRERAQQLRAAGRAGALCAAFLEDYLNRLEARGRGHLGALHDPCTVAYLLQPDLFELQDLFVEVDANEGSNFGRSSADFAHVSGRAPNVSAAVRANEDGVYALLRERLARLG